MLSALLRDLFGDSPKTRATYGNVERYLKLDKSLCALVAIENTMAKGMSNKIMNMLGHRLHVAHVPHRYYALEKEERGMCERAPNLTSIRGQENG